MFWGKKGEGILTKGGGDNSKKFKWVKWGIFWYAFFNFKSNNTICKWVRSFVTKLMNRLYE